MLLTCLKNIVVTPSPREMTWPLRALTVLKDPGFGSQHTHWYLTTMHNSSSRGFSALFWLSGTYIYAWKNTPPTHTHKTIINKSMFKVFKLSLIF